ncbi:hypothetical protein A2U01_0087346, partial [Trifolium medium]|nr:hypothetical protein [Trifolium medium]
GESTRSVGNKTEIEFGVSSSNGWTVRENDSVLGGFVVGLCVGARCKLGLVFAVD